MPSNNPKPLTSFSAEQIQRFQQFVPLGFPHDACWPWLGNRHKRGYGIFWLRNRFPLAAHRVAFFLATGIDPGNLCICHSCDNPPCVNPWHLFLGTHIDNMKDRDSKGRNINRRGEAHGCAKLSQEQVIMIRDRYIDGETMDVLGRMFGVDKTTIAQIVHRRTWTHI